jgi:asparaginyl-tRNA synthetase
LISPKDSLKAKKKAVLSIRAKLLSESRTWFANNGFIEVQGPIIVPAVGNSDSSLCITNLDRKAFLSQGLEPYTDSFITFFPKIFSITPAFRVERRKSNRHLAEFWRIELAVANLDLEGVQTIVENLVSSVCYHLAKQAHEELRLLGRNTLQLENIETPFTRLTYDEAIEQLQKRGHKVQWGQELNWNLEKELSILHSKPFFITKYPITVGNQFFKEDPDVPDRSLVADLLAPEGYGEIGSGGQAEGGKDLLNKMREDEVGEEITKWYFNLRNSDQAYSSFAIGIERYIQWLCRLPSINEAILFPRTLESIYP